MIKIFVIEDHEAIIVPGLRNLFRPSRDHIEVTGSSPGMKSALTNRILESSDLIILDLWLPGEDPIQNLKVLRERFPNIPVLVYTSEELPVWQQKMMAAGAKGYLKKNCPREDLKSAILHIASGGTWFTGPMTDGILPEKEKDPSELPIKNLTPVQKEIVDLLIEGYHYREIARRLQTTPGKIDKTLTALRIKYQCKTTIELVVLLTGKDSSAD